MKNLTLFFLFGMILFSVGCKDDVLLEEEEDLISTEVEIRIENNSDFKFENLMVQIRGTETIHGTLESNEKSDYVLYDAAYRYAYLECEINEELFVIQPIDYIGESLLEPGKYTYVIDASSTIIEKYGRLSMSLRAD